MIPASKFGRKEKRCFKLRRTTDNTSVKQYAGVCTATTATGYTIFVWQRFKRLFGDSFGVVRCVLVVGVIIASNSSSFSIRERFSDIKLPLNILASL